LNLLFAWRYFRSKKTTNAINIIAWISVMAITVGTAALVIVLSVFNGFEDLVKSLYGDFYSDVRITAAKGKYMQFSSENSEKLARWPGIAAVAYTAEEKAVLVNGEYQSIVFLKGVSNNYKAVNQMHRHLVRGKYQLGTANQPTLILGAGVENAIGANPGMQLQPITVYLPGKATASFSEDALRAYQTNPAGTFLIQQEFDNKYAFTNLAFMQYMLDLKPSQYSALEIKLVPGSNANKVQEQLQEWMGSNYLVETRYQQNRSLYSIMQAEKWIIYGILSLILAVAAFNMIGALTMLVLEKQKDMAVLQALGATPNRIHQIFITEGLLLALVGGCAGLILAVFLCFLQLQFKLLKLGNGSFLVDHYPVKVQLTDLLIIMATVVVVAFLAAWLPARKASKQLVSLKS
jgi:lipoprotein-releasing system permease protein